MAAQARMRAAKVLLLNIGAVGTEIAKNIVLSGIGSLTILDPHDITEEDLGAQFFVSEDEIGTKRCIAARPRIQDMNPRVKLGIDTNTLDSRDESYYKQFDLIVATDLSRTKIIDLNKITRRFGIPLYATGLHGLFSYIFVDLIQFDAEDEKVKSSVATKSGLLSQNREILSVVERIDEEQNRTYEKIITRNYYKPFDEMLQNASLVGKLTRRQRKRLNSAVPLILALFSYDGDYSSIVPENLEHRAIKFCEQLGVPSEIVSHEYVSQLSQQAGVEFAPVAAVIGGAVAQDVINILGKRQSPLNNFVILDGITLDMQIFEL